MTMDAELIFVIGFICGLTLAGLLGLYSAFINKRQATRLRLLSPASKSMPKEGEGGGGCLAQGQFVSTPDGLIRIESIMSGDAVLCCDENMDIVTGRVIAKKPLQRAEVIVINGNLSLTPSHEVFCVDFGWKPASELRLGDNLVGFDMSHVKITELRRCSGDFTVYAIETSGQNLFASNTLIHNKCIT
jgi:hypothetical protein